MYHNRVVLARGVVYGIIDGGFDVLFRVLDVRADHLQDNRGTGARGSTSANGRRHNSMYYV